MTDVAAGRRKTTNFRGSVPERMAKNLGFVGLLAARANQVFDGCGSFCTLSLFKFGDPFGDRVDNVVGSLADNFRFATLAVNALSTFDDFYFSFGHN